jgi:hypothetical protein
MFKSISLTLAVLFSFATLFGQSNEISMLDGRFSFTFPDSAKKQPRTVDLMAPNPNTSIETRVVYDIGLKRIVFFAEELFLKSDNNLEAILNNGITRDYPFTVLKKDNLDSSVCYRIIPQKFNSNAQAILLNSIIVKNADNTLSKFSAYVNAEAFIEKAAFDKIIENVFLSFKKGNKLLNLESRTESFEVLATKTIYSINLPDNYIITVDKKYDFEVYKIKKICNYGDKTFGDIIVYFGFHPSFMYNDMQLENFRTIDTEGEYMQQKLTWLNFEDKKKGLYLREQLFIDDDIRKDVNNHIAMIASNEKIIDELALIVKKSLLKYNK